MSETDAPPRQRHMRPTADSPRPLELLGGIEAGGTKWVCAVGDGRGELRDTITFATTTPRDCLSQAIDFFRRAGSVAAVGVGSFGPVEARPDAAKYGFITSTPKPGWQDTDLLSPLRDALGVPLGFDTDVNAAALGEWCWGPGDASDTLAYVTVGTGIGAGAVLAGEPLHGFTHPEFGHVRVPHDPQRDPFAGSCPFHGDCLEGLASGTSLRSRYGVGAEDLEQETAWEIEAEYLASAALTLLYTLAPHRLVLGGGVMKRTGLLGSVRTVVSALNARYVPGKLEDGTTGLEDNLVAPALGDWSGAHGAIELARRALSPVLP